MGVVCFYVVFISRVCFLIQSCESFYVSKFVSCFAGNWEQLVSKCELIAFGCSARGEEAGLPMRIIADGVFGQLANLTLCPDEDEKIYFNSILKWAIRIVNPKRKYVFLEYSFDWDEVPKQCCSRESNEFVLKGVLSVR